MTGQIPEPESNGHMRIGKALEPVIIDLLREDGHATFTTRERESATPRARGSSGTRRARRDPPRYVIECKATGGWALRSWNGDDAAR
jgi:hypothetical protein